VKVKMIYKKILVIYKNSMGESIGKSRVDERSLRLIKLKIVKDIKK